MIRVSGFESLLRHGKRPQVWTFSRLARGRDAFDAVGSSDRRQLVQEPLLEGRVDRLGGCAVDVAGEVTLPPAPELAVEPVKPAFDGQHQPGLVPSRFLEVLAIDRPHHPAAHAWS